MVQLLPAALHRFAIAKEMYIHGAEEARKHSSVSRILAVLNFDYVAETLIKAVLLDKNVKLEKNAGDYKTFPNLINDLRMYYNNASVINEIIALHKARNDIQHNASIPSDQDINRHRLNIRLFFDDICKNIYQSKVTFDSISLAYLVDSKNEIIILTEMETALQKENFADSIMYAKESVQYHKRLMNTNLNAPSIWRQHNYRYILSGLGSQSRIGLHSLPSLDSQAEQYFDELNNAIKWLLDRNIFPQHYEEVEQLLTPFGSHLTPDKENAEQARIIAYNIITGTQWRLKRFKDTKVPVIFDQRIVTRDTKKILLLGIASIYELKEVKLKFSRSNKSEKQSDADAKLGLQEIDIEPDYFRKYNQLRISVVDVKNNHAGAFIAMK